MKRTTTTTMALVVTLALIGIGSMPVQAVPADCSTPFSIPGTEPPNVRNLAFEASEVGMITVDDSGDVDVRVQLESDADRLKFGVFIKVTGSCVSAGGLSTCDDDNLISTEDGQVEPPQEKDCRLDAAVQGDDRDYFFHIVNDGTSALEYKVWEL